LDFTPILIVLPWSDILACNISYSTCYTFVVRYLRYWWSLVTQTGMSLPNRSIHNTRALPKLGKLTVHDSWAQIVYSYLGNNNCIKTYLRPFYNKAYSHPQRCKSFYKVKTWGYELTLIGYPPIKYFYQTINTRPSNT